MLGIGSTLQRDYEEKCKLQDRIILKFKEKKKNNNQAKPVPLPGAWKSRLSLQENSCQVRALITLMQSSIIQLESCEFERLTAGLIREPSIIGITDNQD